MIIYTSLWIKASAKWLNVNVNVNHLYTQYVIAYCLICNHRDLNFPDFYSSGQVLNVCTGTTVKYLGHIINNEMSDDDDMYRWRCKLYAQANMLCILYVFISGKDKPF